MSTEYKKGVREEFDRRLTMVPRWVLDRFTGKPILGGRDVKMGKRRLAPTFCLSG